jgi:hypothetical protein
LPFSPWGAIMNKKTEADLREWVFDTRSFVY